MAEPCAEKSSADITVFSQDALALRGGGLMPNVLAETPAHSSKIET